MPLDEERLEWESTTVLVASADDIVDRIVQDSLIQWLADIRLVLNLAPEAQLMLVVIGLSKYHRDTVSIVNRNFRDMARAAASGSQASGSVVMTVAGRAERDLVENMLLHAQVVERVFIIHGGFVA